MSPAHDPAEARQVAEPVRVGHVDRAGLERHLADQRAQQRRLARAVSAHDDHDLAGLDAHGDVVERARASDDDPRTGHPVARHRAVSIRPSGAGAAVVVANVRDRRPGARSRRNRRVAPVKTTTAMTREHEERQPQRGERRPSQHHALADHREVGERQQVADPAHAGRHRVEREDHAGEQDLGEQEEERGLDRLPRGLRDRRDEDAEPEHHEQEQRRPEGEDERIAVERHVEQHHPEDGHDDQVDRGKDEVRRDLARGSPCSA